MTITSLKELEKLMVLCQKRGVSSITVDGITFHMSNATAMKAKATTQAIPDYSNDIPEANIQVPKFTGEITEPDTIPTDELTPEQLLFYSAAPSGPAPDGPN